MRKCLSTLLVSAALSLGVAGKALAHDDDHEDEHDGLGWEHSQGHGALESRHEGVHDRLGAEHDAAHYYNPYMSRKADRRLHKQLNQNHAWKDNQLNWQHNEMHRELDHQHNAYHGYYDHYDNRYYAPYYLTY